MRLLETWVVTPLAQAVGWTLLHSLWEGAIIAGALAATLWGVRSARARYGAACVAMLLLLGGIGFTLFLAMPEGAPAVHPASAPGFPAWSVPADSGPASPSDGGLSAIVPWFTPFWIAGVWIFALGHLAGWISVCRLRRRGVCCAPEGWQQSLARLSAQLRLSRPVILLESCLAEVPMVVGHVRPAILMPLGLLTGLPPGQVEAILLHELAHIRRHDYLVNACQRAVECLFFYHPAAWWISHVIRAERENCCDDVVVAESGHAQEYAVALAALEQNRWPGRQAAVAGTGGSLMKRIRRLLYPQGANRVWTPIIAAAFVLATAVVALAVWPSKGDSAASTTTSRAEASPYDRWLSEEVVYIIDDAERAAFQKLTTDEERDMFIYQFWARRNPNPGSPENKFKEEHYRRIAYANEHWATSRPGWQTDRGRMYIVYGPPDEIEAHPKGDHSTYARQVWMYHHVEGIGDKVTLTFVDREGTGDYRLAPGNSR